MESEADIFWAVAAFAFGAVVGSFLNVVIIRLPDGHSVVFPASRCTKCDHPIRSYDNIPILSYFLLRGKCRDCGEQISFRYPLIECLTALLCTVLFFKFGLTPLFGVSFVFCSAMLAVFWIDLDHMIIPDLISLNGIIVGLAASVIGLVPGVEWLQSVLGAALGGLSLYVPAYIYEKLRHTEGLGAGDIKLLAMIGAFTGPYGVVFVLFFSSLIGSLTAFVGMTVKNVSSSTPIPFGPFLTAAAVGYVLFGPDIIDKFFELGLYWQN
ncbi:MAG: prepilin peptidase [Desulfomonile tiedjei]|uniref:Prepilin leader peptidase/N-methyltransferase n=1 Tax=Desulfomonile tiedjei TaxID=2358 RepID=A0A9D6Z5G1_9BACT|nr:prepilin peptidase [Desulfomonile tiedjei]